MFTNIAVTCDNGVRSSGRQTNWATDNWATHFGQLGDNIGRVIKDVNIGKCLKS